MCADRTAAFVSSLERASFPFSEFVHIEVFQNTVSFILDKEDAPPSNSYLTFFVDDKNI